MEDLAGSGGLLAGGGILGVIAIKAWDWFLNRRVASSERTAEATLIEGLTARIVALETRMASLEAELATERDAHLKTKAELLEARAKLAGLP